MKKLLFPLAVLLLLCGPVSAQQTTYPKVMGYASVVHPIVTFDKKGRTFNFSGSYTVSFPFGINLLKSDKIGFSMEVAPFIKTKNDTARMTFLLFHPGIIFRYPHGISFITRLAFETNGRFGITPIFNKVIIRKKSVNYFAAVAAPMRAGNGSPASLTLVFQVGVSF